MDERRDDWHRGVDENLASLNAGQRVWEREVNQIHKALAEIDALLRGDSGRDTDGAIARLHQLENELNLLKAVVLKDKAGNKGLIGRVEALESGERGADNRWKFATAVVVATLSLVGLLVTNWDHLETFLNKSRKPSHAQAGQKPKHQKAKPRRVVVHEETPEPEAIPNNSP